MSGTRLLVGGVLASVCFAMLASDTDAGHRRRARLGYGGYGCCQPAVATYAAPACGFQGGCAPATAYMPQNVYGAQTACAVPGYQGYGPAGGMGTYGGGPGTYGSAGHYPDQGQGIQQTGGFQPAPPPPREIDDNDNDNQQ